MTKQEDILARKRDEERELSPEERAELRQLMLAHGRAAWFWSSLGIGLKWVFAVAVGIVAIKVFFAEILSHWFPK